MPQDIYLDYNATCPVRPAAAEAVFTALAPCGNASSVHGFGRAARRRLEDARETVAGLIGAGAGEIIFTSGGTEANNLALTGARRARILTSSVEHDSVLAAAPEAERVPVDEDGRIRLDILAAALDADGPPALLSIMLANNETGVIQPVAEATALAHARGALVHCDAVQGAGRMAIEVAALDVDFLSLSAHKLGGPQGVGALYVKPGADLDPMIRGGGQERGRRAGTGNLAGIAGFAAAAALARSEPEEMARCRALRDRLEAEIAAISPASVFFGQGADRLANTACFTMPGIDSETQVIAFDLAGIAVSAGAACSSGKVGPSHVLRAMGVADEVAATAIRVSLGWRSEAGDIDRLIAAWRALYTRIDRRQAPAA